MTTLDEQFLATLQAVLDECPRCGGVGLALDPSVVGASDIDVTDYDPCPLCDDFRETLRMIANAVD